MKLPDVESVIYGQPYQTPDGATVITVANVHARNESGLRASPMGIFVIKDGKPHWEAAVDINRTAIIGLLTGLIAAALATAAMVRRPPWPDTRISVHRT